MSLDSLHSQVDRVLSVLAELQHSLHYLPNEYQDQVSMELDRVAFQLEDSLQAIHQQAEPRESEHSPDQNRVRGAQGLGQSEAWLGQALKQAHSGAWKWDLVQNTMQWSPEMYALLGIHLDEEISDPLTFFEMIHPDDWEITSHEIEAAIRRGGPFSLEYRVTCGDGKTIWLSSAGTVENDASGRPIRAAGINQDVTYRKLTEEALRESEGRERAKATELKALMDAVPAIIWISRDPECKEMVGNPYGYRFLEMWEGANLSKSGPAMEVAQQPYRNYKNGREIPCDELPMQIAASTGVGASDYEFELVFNNGVTKNLLGNVVPLVDPSGKPTGAVAAFVDITERKRVEEELRVSEAELRSWKEYLTIWSKATHSTFWVLGPDGSYRNPVLTGLNISGKPIDQTGGWNWLVEIIHPEDQERLRNHWQNAIEQQKAFEIDARVWQAESEQYRWFSHRAVPIIEAGTLQGWVGASIDMQARKELEQALRDREAKLKVSEAKERARAAELNAIMEAVPAPILLTHDPKGEEITGNIAAYEILKVQPGTNLAEIFHGKAYTHIKKVIHNGAALRPEEIPLLEALRTGKPVRDFEGTMVTDGGREIIIYGNATPLLDEAEQPTGGVGVFMDITGRLATERALRESEQRFRVALASAPIVVFSMDQDLRYTWIHNPRHRFSEDQMLGKRDDEINLPENVAELMEAKRAVIETGQAVQREIQIQVNGGQFFYIVTLDPIVDPHGQVSGLIGAALDITGQRQLEAVQRENEIQMAMQHLMLETRENERVKIARELHDGPVQTLISTVFDIHKLKEEGVEQVATAELEPIGMSLKIAIRELRQVVNELRPPTLAHFGLVKAIRGYAEDLQDKFPGIDLSLDLAEDAKDLSERLSLTLYRICQEGLQNIIRHAQATQAAIHLAVDGEQVSLEIQDNGIGFPAANDFSRLAKENHFGLLGMKERAEAAGGTLQVFSGPGEGTKIRVRAPLRGGSDRSD